MLKTLPKRLSVVNNNLFFNWAKLTSWFGASNVTEWNKAFSEAERIVGYPTSFMSLRCLLSDELSNVALQMRRLVGTKHPLLKTARHFVNDGSSNLQKRGLVVLLLSKAAGEGPPNEDILERMVSGIYPSQRSLAEIIEMIHTAYLVHKGVVNLESLNPSHGDHTDMEFGNKMAVLSGDFLLANSSTALAQLYNSKVVHLVSSAIRDMMSAEFTRLKDTDGNDCVVADATLAEWENQTFLASGSLLAKSCQAAMMLANHEDALQERAYKFGSHFAFAHQLHEDIKSVKQSKEGNISPISAPVIQYLYSNKDEQFISDLKAMDNKSKTKVCKKLQNSGAITQVENMCCEHTEAAIQSISVLPKSEAKTALENIVRISIAT